MALLTFSYVKTCRESSFSPTSNRKIRSVFLLNLRPRSDVPLRLSKVCNNPVDDQLPEIHLLELRQTSHDNNFFEIQTFLI